MWKYASPENHVTISLDQDYNGKVRFDISVNYPNAEACEKALSESIDIVQRVIAEKKLSPVVEKEDIAVTIAKFCEESKKEAMDKRVNND